MRKSIIIGPMQSSDQVIIFIMLLLILLLFIPIYKGDSPLNYFLVYIFTFPFYSYIIILEIYKRHCHFIVILDIPVILFLYSLLFLIL